MPDVQASDLREHGPLESASAFMRAEVESSFGPSFFLGHLGRFVRDHCPDPKEQLPLVQIHLTDGATFQLCHIIGVSPRWVMLAVEESAHHESGGMAIELVPFDRICGVSIRTRRAGGATAGFRQLHPPDVIAAETLLELAMAPAHPHAEGGREPTASSNV